MEDTDAFCIIEGRETVLDFAQMQLQEIRDNITSRRNKIFLLMEEVQIVTLPHAASSLDLPFPLLDQRLSQITWFLKKKNLWSLPTI